MNDLYIDHATHDKWEKDCSTCFSENLMIKTSFDKVSRMSKLREELGISRNHFTDNQISPNPIRD